MVKFQLLTPPSKAWLLILFVSSVFQRLLDASINLLNENGRTVFIGVSVAIAIILPFSIIYIVTLITCCLIVYSLCTNIIVLSIKRAISCLSFYWSYCSVY